MMMNKFSDRTEILIGESGVETLKNSSVAIIGVGGVGGAVAEMLVRSGVGNLTLVDFDKIDITNINRQIIATTENVGESKVLEWAKRIENINPKCNVTTINLKLDKENVSTIVSNDFDFVVDCIDMVTSKVELICYCKQKGIDVISAMGAGNRIDLPEFKVVDIYKTSNDGLARVMRKKLRERNIESHDVVCAVSSAIALNAEQEERNIGSISYYPVMAGCVISYAVINKLLQKI